MELSSRSLQTVNAKAVLQAQRTSRIFRRCGLDATVMAYTMLHGSMVLLLLSSHTNFGHRFSEASKAEAVITNAHQVYVGFVVLCLTLHSWLFSRLLRSDPGWVQCRSNGHAASSNLNIGMPNICNQCGAVAPLRSRHDFKTGRCVAKFDHWCPFVGTSIGDLNHSTFWFFCLFQTFLIVWAFSEALAAITACLFGDAAARACCWQVQPLRSWLLLLSSLALIPLFNAFAGLTLLHAYLAATGQTTYEMLKGSRVPYLKPYYEGYAGPEQADGRRPYGLAYIIRAALSKYPPPNPFSQGLAENLNVFFFAPKPYPYTLQTSAQRV